uniref:Uncharacterized protein n=1 Tax=Cacopsylla melanoneura TaxID=428564 RepID=A0A8D9B6Q4_9HEMI
MNCVPLIRLREPRLVIVNQDSVGMLSRLPVSCPVCPSVRPTESVKIVSSVVLTLWVCCSASTRVMSSSVQPITRVLASIIKEPVLVSPATPVIRNYVPAVNPFLLTRALPTSNAARRNAAVRTRRVAFKPVKIRVTE